MAAPSNWRAAVEALDLDTIRLIIQLTEEAIMLTGRGPSPAKVREQLQRRLD